MANRREFLAGSIGGALFGAIAPTFASEPQKLPEKWDYTADVVVIGAGATGLPAAIGARDAGLSVRYRRPRDYVWRQCAAWRRHLLPEEVRNQG